VEPRFTLLDSLLKRHDLVLGIVESLAQFGRRLAGLVPLRLHAGEGFRQFLVPPLGCIEVMPRFLEFVGLGITRLLQGRALAPRRVELRHAGVEPRLNRRGVALLFLECGPLPREHLLRLAQRLLPRDRLLPLVAQLAFAALELFGPGPGLVFPCAEFRLLSLELLLTIREVIGPTLLRGFRRAELLEPALHLGDHAQNLVTGGSGLLRGTGREGRLRIVVNVRHGGSSVVPGAGRCLEPETRQARCTTDPSIDRTPVRLHPGRPKTGVGNARQPHLAIDGPILVSSFRNF
jgi:hypothetical protein